MSPLPPTRGGRVELAAVGLTLMWHPDLARVGDRVAFSADVVQVSRLAPEFYAADGRSKGPLADPYVSRSPLEFRRVESGYLVRGRAVLDGRPLEGERVLGVSELDDGVTIEMGKRVVLLLHRQPVVHGVFDDLGLVGDSVAIRRLRREIEVAAASDASVLVRGETGVGKELVAQALHRRSARANGPYVTVNVAAIPPAVAASAFFGHIRGAFSGAERTRAGYFEAAATGTLFLDEVGDLPTDVQPVLLRALQSGEVQPVGGQEPSKVDVRIVAATDADLDADSFSRPLLYRLAEIEIEVPPLRARREDITRLLLWGLRRELALADAVDRLEQQKGQEHLWLDAPTVAMLCRHAWPGNVRELLSVARQIALVGRGRAHVRSEDVAVLGRIARRLAGATTDASTSGDWGYLSRSGEPISDGEAETSDSGTSDPADLTPEVVADALREARWSVSAAARALGVARTTLYRWARRYDLARNSTEVSDEEVRAAWRAVGGDFGAMSDLLRLSPHSLATRINALGLPSVPPRPKGDTE